MWKDYKSLVSQHTVTGDLRVKKAVRSQQLENKRDILVWLPPSYAASEKHYPVLYMHDGFNLFDTFSSYSGEWGVDETMTVLAAEGIEAIIVGIPNQGQQRFTEYNPYPIRFHSQHVEGRGDDYIAFITDTLKPMIDRTFRTDPSSASTGIAGSSMGGLISLHGFLTRQDVFGFCGAFSPVFWIGTGLQQSIEELANGTGRVYLDIGAHEGSVILQVGTNLAKTEVEGDRFYLKGVRHLRSRLLTKGYVEGSSLLYVEDSEGRHNEETWARHLPAALRFLIPH